MFFLKTSGDRRYCVGTQMSCLQNPYWRLFPGGGRSKQQSVVIVLLGQRASNLFPSTSCLWQASLVTGESLVVGIWSIKLTGMRNLCRCYTICGKAEAEGGITARLGDRITHSVSRWQWGKWREKAWHFCRIQNQVSLTPSRWLKANRQTLLRRRDKERLSPLPTASNTDRGCSLHFDVRPHNLHVCSAFFPSNYFSLHPHQSVVWYVSQNNPHIVSYSYSAVWSVRPL